MRVLLVFYDNWCPNCTKFSTFIQKYDKLHLVKFVPMRDEADTSKYPDLDVSLAQYQMASFDHKWYYGFDSLFYILLRIPIFWICIPLMYFLKITNLGKIIYTRLAIRRSIIPIHCNDESCAITTPIK